MKTIRADRPAMFRPTVGRVALGAGVTIGLFAVAAAAITFAFIREPALGLVAAGFAFVYSAIGATIAAPIGILLVLAANFALRNTNAPVLHAIGTFVAGAATGAFGIWFTFGVAVVPELLLSVLPYIGIGAVTAGACAVIGWLVVYRGAAKVAI